MSEDPHKDTLLTPLWTLLFWPLVGCVVFFGLLLYSLHIPASFEAPVKGLSALIASTFALFGLKWDAAAKGASAHHLFRFRTIMILGVILATILLILGVERCVYVKVRAIPGTSIHVDGEYRDKITPIAPDGNALDPGELRERVIAIPLRWGWRTIQLKDNPLSPGNVEEFRENIRFPLLEWDLVRKLWDGKSEIEVAPGSIKEHVANGSSQWDRRIRSRMTIVSLIDFEPVPVAKDPASPQASPAVPPESTTAEAAADQTCRIISSGLKRFWSDALTSQEEHGNLRSRLSQEHPSLLIIRPAPVQPDSGDEVVIDILPRSQRSVVPLVSIGFPASAADVSTFRTAAASLLDVLPDVLSSRIADEDLALWYTRRFVATKERLGHAIGSELADAAARRHAEAFAEVSKAITAPGKAIDERAAADVRQVLQSLQAAPSLAPEVMAAVGKLEQIDYAAAPSLPPEATAELQEAFATVKPALGDAPPPTPVIYLHFVGEAQRGTLEKIEAALKAGDSHRRVLGFENVEGKARIPDRLEVRYFVKDEAARSRAEEIVREIEAAMGWSAGEKARALYVVPSEFDRRNAVDLSYQFELWPANDSF